MVPPPKLYRIAEIVHHTKLSRQTIHNYTTFGLIREAERMPGSNYRLYGEEVFHRLNRILEMKKQDKKMHEILSILREEDAMLESQMLESQMLETQQKGTP
ncbi:MAG TPA: MerR family transcriptional regulator [Planctomycetota bacterium]|nr:MerR family transcriptional regulator [Planctomycetota bacterium]